jgi:hypothetical protein
VTFAANPIAVALHNEVSLTWSANWACPTCIALGTPTSTRLILYDDPNDDGDPSDAVYLTEATTNVTHYGFPITTVIIPTRFVSGKFFVAALVQNIPAGSIWTASVDGDNVGAPGYCEEDALGGFNVNNYRFSCIIPAPNISR